MEKKEDSKKTLGQQILSAYDKNHSDKGPECREIVLEYGKKEFLPRLQKIIQTESKKFPQKFYIMIFGYKDNLEVLASHIRIIVRQTRPKPEPQVLLYSHNPIDDCTKIEWMLPSEQEIDRIYKDPESVDSMLAECCIKFHNGKLR